MIENGTQSLEELLAPARQAVLDADAAYEAALGASDEKPARDAYKAAKAKYRLAERDAFADGLRWTCGRCGGSGHWVNGGVCFNCGGSGFHPTPTPHKFEADPATRAKRHAAFLAEKAAEEAAYSSALATLPTPVAEALSAAAEKFERIGGYYNPADPSDELDREETFLYGLSEKLRKYGSLTVGQVGAVERGLARKAQRAADEAALATTPPLAEGKREIEGVVISTKAVHSENYGTTYKMLVKLDDGTKVFGTIPSALDSVETQPGVTRGLGTGDRVAFSATVERSNDDPHFGFFKRPTKARIVEAAV